MIKLTFILFLLPVFLFSQTVIDSSIYIFKNKRLTNIEYVTKKVELSLSFNNSFFPIDLKGKCTLKDGFISTSLINYYKHGIIKNYHGLVGNNEFEGLVSFDKQGILKKIILKLDNKVFDVLALLDSAIKGNNNGNYSYIYASRKDTNYQLNINFNVLTKKIESVKIFRNNERFGCWYYFDKKVKLTQLIHYYSNSENGIKAIFNKSKPFIVVNQIDNKHEGLFFSHMIYQNRKLAYIKTYNDNVENGSNISFFKNGKVSSIFEIRNGKAINSSYFFYKNGKIKKQFNYWK